MSREPVVFIGPSLPLEQARMLFSEARFEPPIKRHDLQALVEEGYDRFGIIDGEFFQNLSVSPKEILQYLKQGITIYGSSSMGALRASELHPFGMIGVGQVFTQYKNHFLRSDDEVALLFDAVRFRPLSEPMVNIRHAFYQACKRRVITPAEYRLLTDTAVGLNYPQRTYAKILRKAAGEGLSPQTVDIFQEWRRGQGLACDLKGLDAVRLLRALQREYRKRG